jgi:hypothetical protein
MNHDPKDRFGMPESAFQAASDSHGDSSVFRMGSYVPTREEVATLSVDALRPCLIDWMWESPTELIPSREQIAEVQAILEARPDAEDFVQLILVCRGYTKVNSSREKDDPQHIEKTFAESVDEFLSVLRGKDPKR